MSDHALYLTIAYAATAVLITLELALLRARGKKLKRYLNQRDD